MNFNRNLIIFIFNVLMHIVRDLEKKREIEFVCFLGHLSF